VVIENVRRMRGRLRGRSHLFTQKVPLMHICAVGFWCGRMDRGTRSLPIGGGGGVVIKNVRRMQGRMRGRSHLFTQKGTLLYIRAAGGWCGRMDRGTRSLPRGGGVVGENVRFFERSGGAAANPFLMP
jgi:hypothetical protein